MYEQGFITEDEYKQAYGEELVFKSSIRNVGVQDYYADLLIQDVIDDLMEKYGYSENYATNMVYFGGLRIESAEVLSQQEKVESIYANDANFPAPLKNDKENPQGAILIMDYDGRVVATAGGRGEKTANRIANREMCIRDSHIVHDISRRTDQGQQRDKENALAHNLQRRVPCFGNHIADHPHGPVEEAGVHRRRSIASAGGNAGIRAQLFRQFEDGFLRRKHLVPGVFLPVGPGDVAVQLTDIFRHLKGQIRPFVAAVLPTVFVVFIP